MNTFARGTLLMVAMLALFASNASGYIKTPTNLALFVRDSTQIVQVKVSQFSPEKNSMVLDVEQDLKGKAEQRSWAVLWKFNTKYKEQLYVPALLKRFGQGQQAILFINDGGKFFHTMQRKDPVAYGYVNGSWFFMTSTRAGGDKTVWKLEQGEPYLRSTYKGDTADLNKLLADHLAGKVTLPEPRKEEPGFGPEFHSKK